MNKKLTISVELIALLEKEANNNTLEFTKKTDSSITTVPNDLSISALDVGFDPANPSELNIVELDYDEIEDEKAMFINALEHNMGYENVLMIYPEKKGGKSRSITKPYYRFVDSWNADKLNLIQDAFYTIYNFKASKAFDRGVKVLIVEDKV